MGELLEVIEYLEANDGELPESHDGEFGKGGCIANAMAAIGRIWDFRDQVADSLDTVRSSVRQSSAMTEAASDLEACASEIGVPGVTGPGTLEEQYASGAADHEQFKKIESTCVAAWIDTERIALLQAENHFFAEHEEKMQQQIETYGPVHEQSRTDASFARALAGLLVSAP